MFCFVCFVFVFVCLIFLCVYVFVRVCMHTHLVRLSLADHQERVVACCGCVCFGGFGLVWPGNVLERFGGNVFSYFSLSLSLLFLSYFFLISLLFLSLYLSPTPPPHPPSLPPNPSPSPTLAKLHEQLQYLAILV